MKRIIIIVISLFIMPILVNAETLTFNVCKDGCEYTNLSSISSIVNNVTEEVNIIINITDSSEYEENYVNFYNDNINSIIINGNNSIITNDGSNGSIYFEASQVIIKDIKFYTNEILFQGRSIDSIDSYSNRVHLNNTFNISNCEFNAKNNNEYSLIRFGVGTFNIDNSIINTSLATDLASVHFNNSKVNKEITNIIMYAIDSHIYLYSNSSFNHNMPRRRLTYNDLMAGINEIQLYMNGYLTEYDSYELLADSGLPREVLNGGIHIYQDIEKTIKNDMNISEFEPEFKNTYENSIGYDDIKELPIEWKSENESIATLDNGTIKPIANGQVDLVGTRGNDIYTMHLTVDMPAKKTNEKKVRMAPSTKITLNSVFKDLDISSLSDDVWEISNPKVAKVVNGEIISLSKGTTDITGIVNGVKYVYHLTVSDTLVSKEVKVPITGKNIKLWIVIVTALLLSVIGICSYILIRKRK